MIVIRVSGPRSADLASKIASMQQVEGKLVRHYRDGEPDSIPADTQVAVIQIKEEQKS